MIGHRAARLALEAGPLPSRVLLFIGPSSVGKWTMAEHLAEVWGIHPVDLVKISKLTMEDAINVVDLLRKPSVYGPRMVIIRLDGSRSAAQQALLLQLEDVGTNTTVILTASDPVVPTLMSRALVFQFSRLSEDDVREVLRRRNFNEHEAERLAAASGGQVRTALALADGGDERIQVLAAVRTIVERDAEALDNLATRWTDSHSKALCTLCTEVISGRPRFFQKAEVEGMTPTTALRILKAARVEVRPRLFVRSHLASVLRGPR